MSRNTAPGTSPTSESSAGIGVQTAVPTGYRVSIVPGALEVSARLATAEELRSLAKVLRASIAILEEEPEGDADALTLTKRLRQTTSA